MSLRPKRDDAELERIASDIAYEVSMMLGALAAFSGQQVSEHVWKNLAMEGFLLHLRNLRDFFYSTSESSKPDDVLAEDYVSSWDTDRPPLAQVIAEKRERLNRQLAHLSYSRLRFQKSWGNLDEMRGEIMKTANSFLEVLPEDKRDWHLKFWQSHMYLPSPKSSS